MVGVVEEHSSVEVLVILHFSFLLFVSEWVLIWSNSSLKLYEVGVVEELVAINLNSSEIKLALLFNCSKYSQYIQIFVIYH